MGYQSAHHDQLDHARVRRDVQKTESERSEEFHIQPTLLLGLALTTSISFNLFLIFYIYRKSLFVSLPQDIKVLAWTAQQESISQIFTTLVFSFITLFELFLNAILLYHHMILLKFLLLSLLYIKKLQIYLTNYPGDQRS